MKYTQFYLYLSLVYLFLGIFILNEKPRALANRVFAVITVGISAWVGGFYLLSETAWCFADDLALFGGILAIGGFYYFSLIFPVRLESINKKLALKLAPLAVLLALLPFNFFIISKHTVHGFQPVNGPLFPLLALVEIAYIIGAAINLLRQVKQSRGVQKQKVYYLILSLSFFLLIAAFFDLALPLMHFTQWTFIGPVASLIFLLTAVLGLTSFRFPDLRVFSASFFTNFLSVCGAFLFWSIFYDYNPRGEVDLVIEFIIAVGIFLVFRLALSKISEMVFLGGIRKFNRLLNELSYLLSQEVSVQKIIFLVNQYLLAAMSLDWMIYYDLKSGRGLVGPAAVEFRVPQEIVQNLSHPEFLELADSKEPLFLLDQSFGFIKKQENFPSALMPVYSEDGIQGFFILGPQNTWYGLSNFEILQIRQIYLQILTAYSRAALFENLEKTVQDQVQDLDYKNRKLAEIMENRLEFLKMTSHQLRTPVASLSGALDLLDRGKIVEPEKSELIRISFNKAKSLGNIITGILHLSKVEKSGSPAVDLVVELQKLLENVVLVLEPLRESKEVTIKINNIPAELRVQGNPTYLEQAIFNVLENSLQHSHARNINISVQVSTEIVVLQISDDGVGIPTQLQSHIFAKHTTGASGTGLGLYLAKTILDLHQKGHIWFDSSNQGTTFYIRLKRSK